MIRDEPPHPPTGTWGLAPTSGRSGAHVLAFVTACRFAKHLKALRWRTPFQAVCDAWKGDPSAFRIDPRATSSRGHTPRRKLDYVLARHLITQQEFAPGRERPAHLRHVSRSIVYAGYTAFMTRRMVEDRLN